MRFIGGDRMQVNKHVRDIGKKSERSVVSALDRYDARIEIATGVSDAVSRMSNRMARALMKQIIDSTRRMR